ncbi:MAG: IclR family transcriptional regulator [Blastococcus sp.]|jgi:DNA-binding IclR family transcriptional regulator|nr:IclR family transcriptional regulator [Blastococcus sp.]
MDTEDSKSLVNSVLRACRVVELLATDGPEVSLSHAAEATDLTRPTAHRLLATLTVAGWVRRTSTGRYALTGKLAGVGAAASQGGSLRDVAHPLVERVALTTGDTAYLIATREDRALCIDRMEGPHPIRVHHVSIGDLLPLTSGAGPVTILANRPDLQAGLQLSPAQEDRLEEARRKGYVVSPDDLLPGVTAIGAPVRDAGGLVVAGLSVTGTNDRLRGRHRTEVIAQVVAAADEISELLGHRVTAPKA